MKYVSLDIETSSLVPSYEHVLMVSMVVEDSKKRTSLRALPHLTLLIKHPEIKGQPFALNLNAWIIEELIKKESTYTIVDPITALGMMRNFIKEHFGNSRAIVAGKNVAMFDLKFLPESLVEMFVHRTLDPTLAFIDWKYDAKPPTLTECLQRAELTGQFKLHDAYDDALAVVALLRSQYNA